MSAPTVASLKSQGNAAFASKDWTSAVSSYSQALDLETDDTASAALLSNRSAAYLHLGKFDEALADANLAVLRRPTWSKAYARVAEVYARQQNCELAKQAYEQAIRNAEDEATKQRYAASLVTTLTSAATSRASATAKGTPLQSASAASHFAAKVEQLKRTEGFRVDPAGGLAMTLAAHNNCKAGMEMLDNVMVKMVAGNIHGSAFSRAVPDICECILIDEVGFMCPSGKDPRWPLVDKFNKVVKFEVLAGNATKYFTNAVWSPKDIIDDLDKRKRTEGQDWIRMVTSALVRGQVVTAFAKGGMGEQGAAVTAIKLALGLLEEGTKTWATIPNEDKGMCFEPTFIRLVRVYLLKCLLRATRDAKTPSAKKMFTLEAVEELANELIEENKEDHWPAFNGTWTRQAYHVMPRYEALAALAFVWMQRAQKPLQGYKMASGTAALADVEAAKKAADLYDQVAASMPEDLHQQRAMRWHGLDMHLRAGGMSIKELFRRAEDAERITNNIEKIFDKLPASFDSRVFVRTQVDSVRQSLSQLPPGQGSVNDVIKPVPTLNMRGTPRGFNPQSAFAPGFIEGLPGSVCVVDVLG